VNVLVVSGTDTGVGKTIVAAALAALALARGERVAVVKPVQTGVEPGQAGDLDDVRRLSGVEDLHELVRLRDPLAPATAARVGLSVLPTVAEMAAAIERLRDRDLVIIEGSGGLLVWLDERAGTVLDLALALKAPVLVVARAGLGTLNHTALTCEALRSRGADCHGVVIGSWPDAPDLAARCNLDDLPVYARMPLLGRMSQNAGALSQDAFLAAAREGLAVDA
jgi:dethiobiotin synthase